MGRSIFCPREYRTRWRRLRELRAAVKGKVHPMTTLRRTVRRTTHTTTGTTTGTFSRVLVLDPDKGRIVERTFSSQTILSGTLTLTMEGALVAGIA